MTSSILPATRKTPAADSFFFLEPNRAEAKAFCAQVSLGFAQGGHVPLTPLLRCTPPPPTLPAHPGAASRGHPPQAPGRHHAVTWPLSWVRTSHCGPSY